MAKVYDRLTEIERSIIKTYRKELWAKFVRAIDDYELISPGDKICVCISGGKDSMILAKLFQELHRHTKFPFEVKFLMMNPGYNKENLDLIMHNLEVLGIPAHIVESNIFEVANSQEKNPCYLCARMRRGVLYKAAKEMGCNKIALGHNYDDAIETYMMNILYNGVALCFEPVTYYEDKNISIIRPLVFANEYTIKKCAAENNLPVAKKVCPADGNTKREETKTLLQQLKSQNKNALKNIFTAILNSDEFKKYEVTTIDNDE